MLLYFVSYNSNYCYTSHISIRRLQFELLLHTQLRRVYTAVLTEYCISIIAIQLNCS